MYTVNRTVIASIPLQAHTPHYVLLPLFLLVVLNVALMTYNSMSRNIICCLLLYCRNDHFKQYRMDWYKCSHNIVYINVVILFICFRTMKYFKTNKQLKKHLRELAASISTTQTQRCRVLPKEGMSSREYQCTRSWKRAMRMGLT